MGLMTRLANGRGLVVPVMVGVFALVFAGLFAFVTLRGADDEDDNAAPSRVETTEFVHRKGGFSVEVPEGFTNSRKGRTATFTSKNKRIVVTVGPSEDVKLARASELFLQAMRAGYTDVSVIGRERQKVAGRPALLTSGRATNAEDVKIRFVAVNVRNRPANYTIAAYTAFDSEPADVLPKVNAVVNGFEILDPKSAP